MDQPQSLTFSTPQEVARYRADQAIVECLLATARINAALLHVAQLQAYATSTPDNVAQYLDALQRAYDEAGALSSRLRRAFPDSIA